MAQILIANDNADLLECCQAILEAEGHVVRAVEGGENAIALVREWQPDVVVIDYVMPDTDGPAAIAAWRAAPATANVPILLMSGDKRNRRDRWPVRRRWLSPQAVRCGAAGGRSREVVAVHRSSRAGARRNPMDVEAALRLGRLIEAELPQILSGAGSSRSSEM